MHRYMPNTGNMQGTYKFLSLETSRLIQGRRFEVLPMLVDVVRKVNATGKEAGNETQFRDRHGEETEDFMDAHQSEEEIDSQNNDDYDDYFSVNEEMIIDGALIYDTSAVSEDGEVTANISNIVTCNRNAFMNDMQAGKLLPGYI